MSKPSNVLVINPGSTSTKVALFDGEKRLFQENISHSPKELGRFGSVYRQKDFRKRLILNCLKKKKICPEAIGIIVGRGGLTKPIAGGIYYITPKMLRDIKNKKIHGREHASGLGSLIAYDIAKALEIKAVTMDPVATDEMSEIARVSGVPEIARRSLFHALNVKAVAGKARAKLKKKNARLVIAHMGGGISVAAYENGRVIDVNNAVLGMGPFSPQRAGSLPLADLVELAFSKKYSKNTLLKKLAKKSGLTGYLGTDDVIKIQKRIRWGDRKAKLILTALAYQIAKEIGAYAAVLNGKVDAVVFTGGLSRSSSLIRLLKEKVSFLAKVLVFPGEEELNALRDAGLAVLRKKIKVKRY